MNLRQRRGHHDDMPTLRITRKPSGKPSITLKSQGGTTSSWCETCGD